MIEVAGLRLITGTANMASASAAPAIAPATWQPTTAKARPSP